MKKITKYIWRRKKLKPNMTDLQMLGNSFCECPFLKIVFQKCRPSWKGRETETDFSFVASLDFCFISGTRFSSFTRIPYASPPVGDRRFKKPSEPPLWHGTLGTARSRMSYRCPVNIYSWKRRRIMNHAKKRPPPIPLLIISRPPPLKYLNPPPQYSLARILEGYFQKGVLLGQ